MRSLLPILVLLASPLFAAERDVTPGAGTLAAGDFLRSRHPGIRVVATEALQCPTLLRCGFGGHRIEGIGDKHIPWIHNVRNTDMVVAVDDEPGALEFQPENLVSVKPFTDKPLHYSHLKYLTQNTIKKY